MTTLADSSDADGSDSIFAAALRSLSKQLDDARCSGVQDIDAIVLSGDVTDLGKKEEWAAFRKMVRMHPAISRRLVLIHGNHDLNFQDFRESWKLLWDLAQKRALPSEVQRARCRLQVLEVTMEFMQKAWILQDLKLALLRTSLGPEIWRLIAADPEHRSGDIHTKGEDPSTPATILQWVKDVDALWRKVFPLVVKRRIGGRRLAFILLDSVASSTTVLSNAYGYVRPDTLRRLIAIATLLRADDFTPMAVIHHHPATHYSLQSEPRTLHRSWAWLKKIWEWVRRREGAMLIENSDELLNALAEANIGIVFHGHQHHREIGHHKQNGLIVIGAGSTTARSTNGSEEPSFSLLDIAIQEGGSIQIGRIDYWMYQPKSKRFEVIKAELKVAVDNNELGSDIYKRTTEARDSMFLSPYSIAMAMAMLYEGTGGNTAMQISKALHFGVPPARLRPGLQSLSRALESPKNAVYSLHRANALWTMQGYEVQASFLNVLRTNYEALLQQVRFTEREAACATINDWMSEATRGKIEELSESSLLTSVTRFVATNAIYFKGEWTNRFKAVAEPLPFKSFRGKQVKALFMHLNANLGYRESDDEQVLSLPYKGAALSMILVLPRRADGLPAIEAKLNAASLAQWCEGLGWRMVSVFMPRFTIESMFSLSGALAELGMSDVFDDRADCSSMDEKHRLFIKKLTHKSLIDVNCEGTEMAAATDSAAAIVEANGKGTEIVTAANDAAGTVEVNGVGAEMGTAVTGDAAANSNRRLPLVFRAEHPFLFFIRHDVTGSILLIGKLAPAPEAKH
jgi:serpin B